MEILKGKDFVRHIHLSLCAFKKTIYERKATYINYQ